MVLVADRNGLHKITQMIPLAKRLRQDVDPRQFCIINKVKERRMEKFKTTQTTYSVTFQDIEVTDDMVAAVKTLFSAVLEDLTRCAEL